MSSTDNDMDTWIDGPDISLTIASVRTSYTTQMPLTGIVTIGQTNMSLSIPQIKHIKILCRMGAKPTIEQQQQYTIVQLGQSD